MTFSVFSVADFRNDGFRMESGENVHLEGYTGRIVTESTDTSRIIRQKPIAVVSPAFGFLMQSGDRLILESGSRLLEEDLGLMLFENGELLIMEEGQTLSLEGDWTRRQLFMTKTPLAFLLEDRTGFLHLENDTPYLYED